MVYGVGVGGPMLMVGISGVGDGGPIVVVGMMGVGVLPNCTVGTAVVGVACC